jgi:GMP synthase (glutamine-hydrolysing)
MTTTKKLLLLQARNPEDKAAAHERLAFREILEIEPETLRAWDLLGGPPTERELDQVACVLVGGAGEYSVTQTGDVPWLGGFIDFMGLLAEQGFPTFASCFGFQALVVAGGGEVVTDKSRAEVGTFETWLTDAGAADPLFAPLGSPFFAQFGHKDHATRLPAGVLGLASSARSPHQALRLPDKPVYATQFHPELSMTRNRERFLNYIEAYSKPDMADTPDEVLAAFRETPEASALMKRFVDPLLAD